MLLIVGQFDFFATNLPAACLPAKAGPQRHKVSQSVLTDSFAAGRFVADKSKFSNWPTT
jgi:hypothetical protein